MNPYDQLFAFYKEKWDSKYNKSQIQQQLQQIS